jgi:glutamate synthase (ferredoxin)
MTHHAAPHALTLAPDHDRPHDACGVGFVARADGIDSHRVVELALTALARVAHRGAASTDQSGDGAGLLTRIPVRLFHREGYRLGLKLRQGEPFAIGMLFLPADAAACRRAVTLTEEVMDANHLPRLGWRDVPVDLGALGPTARGSCPAIRQVFLGRPEGVADDEAWERALFLARRDLERRAAEEGLAEYYVCSLSCRTIVYKALLTGPQLAAFYTDFRYPEFESSTAVFHQRYSTNTLPSWPLAQPFRLIAHNGEINTLWGNRNAMAAREKRLSSPVWGREVTRLRPVLWAEGSDSANFDNAMELLVRSGRDSLHTMMMLVPQAWERYPDVEPAIRDFYEYHAGLIEPWDGPAAFAFSDGIITGAATDRNGLRPCRYQVTRDGFVIAGSEAGLVDLDPREVVETGRLGPCELLAVDTARGRILRNMDVKRAVAARRPYGRWVAAQTTVLEPDSEYEPPHRHPSELVPVQQMFGYGYEDLRFILDSMARTGADPVWSMGDDTPIPPLSRMPQPLYAFFRQRFAQVTNPPLDPIREAVVMSLRMQLGRQGSFLREHPRQARLLRIDHPVLVEEEMAALRQLPEFGSVTLSATWPAADGPEGLRAAIDRLCLEADRAARQGARLLILSDRAADRHNAPIPMLLAVGAVRRHLLDKGLRLLLGLVIEVGDAWDVHHAATLFGYGAEAIHPWLALETVATLEPERPTEARQQYRTSLEKGLLKIMSKMGIAVLPSYCGAQIFEVLGLGAEVIDYAFRGTPSHLGGLGLEEIGEDALARHAAAWKDHAETLPDYGRLRFRKDAEHHGWSPQTVNALQKATGSDKKAVPKGLPRDEESLGREAEKADGTARYGEFVARVLDTPPASPRDLLRFREMVPVSLDTVEPAEAIRRRFVSSAMSLGALSPEAHSTISIAMNRMGARSNSGEGGEDPHSYEPTAAGDRADNRIKQVASGRFGVTTEYLVHAEELEIKIVQGAKPGEGGQLPGYKVTGLIARLRHAVEGIPLISPPPHHDIYSIEDLAQLITDLKTVNPRARVGVKLVAEAGVGTVAAGVAKAYADYVLIAGHSGGTGASALSSIKHAGSPWELGLAEAQHTLVRNGLRHRIEVRVDGGFKTGRDVVIAALLGAESYGFGTAPLVAMGCAMARQCHLNTCPTGIATQRADLRQKFRGTPEQVVAYFTFVAEEVRQVLATLGARSLDEIIGRADLLERLERPDVPRAQMLDLSALLAPAKPGCETAVRRTELRNDRPGFSPLDDEILQELLPCLDGGHPFSGTYTVKNHHLAIGARVAGTIARRFGAGGLPRGRVRIRCLGSAGQSFGAFAINGMRLDLEGEANDYVGKGLSGGEISIRPFRTAAYAANTHENVILGNTALYGATSGVLFAAGQAGSRFAVRNSGATAVIEGAGNHCCEYMTGGTVVVLGATGRNFGAGMTHGVAYVLDESGSFPARCNHESVSLGDPDSTESAALFQLVSEHLARTGSVRARTIVEQWNDYLPLIRKVVPRGTPTARVVEVPAEPVPAGR